MPAAICELEAPLYSWFISVNQPADTLATRAKKSKAKKMDFFISLIKKYEIRENYTSKKSEVIPF